MFSFTQALEKRPIKNFTAILTVLLGQLYCLDLVRADVLVLSAASTASALTEIAQEFEDQSNITVRVSPGSSGTLARQIKLGAPADIYVSASNEWTDQLVASGHLEQGTTRTLIRNRLVFVAPIDARTTGLIDLTKPIHLIDRLDGSRLSMGDPAHVPAGQYAKEALKALGLWTALRDRLSLHTNVRVVLAFVERSEAPIGIVYATDVMLSAKDSAHEPIVYTSSILRGKRTPDVIAFYKWIQNGAARETFSRYGFGLVEN